MKDLPSREDVLKANIDFHAVLADTYEAEQPHYRPENKALVSAHLASLADSAGSDVLIDFGCGSGFIIDLAVPYFQTIFGVDVTPEMLSKVDLSSGKVKLIKANTESVPLADNIANVITANSFLHHLWDIRPTVAEAYRLLKAGGVFYSEEDPNAYFWEAIKSLGALDERQKNSLSDLLSRELSAVFATHTEIASTKGIDSKTVQMAEYQKMMLGGMRAEEVEAVFYQAGFSKVSIEYYWFLGQAKVIHQSSPKTSQDVESYLRSVLPLSNHLFKYFRVKAWK